MRKLVELDTDEIGKNYFTFHYKGFRVVVSFYPDSWKMQFGLEITSGGDRVSYWMSHSIFRAVLRTFLTDEDGEKVWVALRMGNLLSERTKLKYLSAFLKGDWESMLKTIYLSLSVQRGTWWDLSYFLKKISRILEAMEEGIEKGFIKEDSKWVGKIRRAKEKVVLQKMLGSGRR